MNKKTLGLILMALGMAVLATGLVLRFVFKNDAVSLDATALCLIGLSLSLDYTDEKYRTILWVFRGLALAVFAVGMAGCFAAFPQPMKIAIGLAAIVVNLPLAALGLKKSKNNSQEGAS